VRRIDPRNFQRATRTTSKEINRQIVLNLVRAYQPISRADLARRMKVARGMVSPLVNELIECGLLFEAATGTSQRGRKPTLLHVRAHDRLVVGIDVRLSETQVLLTDFAGRTLALELFRTPATPGELVDELGQRIPRLLESHACEGTCQGVGIVLPGMVEPSSGRLVNAPTLGWRDVDLRTPLQALLGLDVHVERDAVACALAQMWQRRPEPGLDSFVYVTFSDGVGTGLVVNGRVVRGHGSTAGEFGHVPLSLDGPACSCGSLGCWEAYTSSYAIVARHLGLELTGRDGYAAVRESGLTVGDVIARARAGDEVAGATLTATARYIGVGLAAIVNALNPARIVVGGDIAGAWDLIGADIVGAMRERTLTDDARSTPVVPEASDHQTRLRGAAALVVAPLFAAPAIG
jgi:N-acetylglucosamine repressor